MDRRSFISYAEGIQKELRRFLTALCCGNAARADDIAQNTLVKAYLGMDTFREESRFRAWIFKIAYNTFLDSTRRMQPEVDLDSAAAVAADGAADDAFRYQALYTALAEIPARERTAILLYYMEGYDVREVAAMTDESEGNVRQHLSRGRKHLKVLLED